MLEAKNIDPVAYEIYRHRLFNILEEGRIAMKMVSGSPVVVEGGETMCSFYSADATPILTAAGILLHCTGARDFVKKAIEWYQDDPGINEGDQFFFNDPYLGGQHLPDQIIIKPIFYEGQCISWVGSFMHTPETGGIEPGGQPASSTEIFHEGFRILGLKIVENDNLRPEIFKTIVAQVRDPHLVGLDIKAKIAANNVCAKRYLELVKSFGPDFVNAASKKIIDESEAMAREKLRRLPDGIWRSRLYSETGIQEQPIKVQCTMTKTSDDLTFDFSGSSPQVVGSMNSTLAATWGNIFSVLSSQLFWDVPWNGGMIKPVTLIAPEGTVVNCTFPAACANGVLVPGKMVGATAHECIAKMLYVGGLLEDVNSGWTGCTGGVPYFGGKNQHGNTCTGMILDSFSVGIGATPFRDGVDTGGQMLNPTSNVSDVEIIELNIPILYLGRRNATDSAGFGKYDGGMGPEMVYMVYGSENLHFGLSGGARRTCGGIGIFGGYPPAVQESRFNLGSDIKEWFQRSKIPRTFASVAELRGKIIDPPNSFPAIQVKEYDLLINRLCGGSGYGDPLDKDPNDVLRKVKKDAISRAVAETVYGVVFEADSHELDWAATEVYREEIRKKRLASAKTPSGLTRDQVLARPLKEGAFDSLLRIHEYLELARINLEEEVIRCLKCGFQFCETGKNYKDFALYRENTLADVNLRLPVSGDHLFVVFQEYLCPGCGTLLEVDQYCPELDQENPVLWDIEMIPG